MTLRGNPALLSNIARDVLADAQQAHRDAKLGFLVGAGLSTPIGLPGWNAFNLGLVQGAFDRHAPADGSADRKALARAYLDQLQGQSLAAADFVRKRVGSDFHVVVRAALYERKELRRYEPTEVHHALCKLAVESAPPFPCLHTTNYDELLELALSTVAGKRAAAVHATRRTWADGPRVVHLHGYFPFAQPPAAHKARLARELILTDLDFSRLSNDHAAWTNRELLTLLDARAVLILGMSLTDPNVRRLFAYLSDRPKDDGPQHFVVLQHHQPEADSAEAREAARLLDEDEHDFWKARGVKILRIQSWDRLNYLLRRIRFADTHWDKRHRELRVQWLRAALGVLDLDDDGLQALGTRALEHARDAVAHEVGLQGRTELNLFLPLSDGSYRRAFSSIAGRAKEAPRRFVPLHDGRAPIPEVEAALTLGQPMQRVTIGPGARGLKPPPGEPPFQTWYKSLVSVPVFDDAAGGVPVAVLQLCSSEAQVTEALSATQAQELRALMREVVHQALTLLRNARPPSERRPERPKRV